MTKLDYPSARELRISAAHRRAIMRESLFQTDRALVLECVRDGLAVRAVEMFGPIRLEIAGGAGAADRLRASHLRSAEHFHTRAVDYLTRRAAGESARSIRDARYPRV